MESLFFWISKLIWLALSPDSLLLLSVALASILLWLGKSAMAARILGITVAAMLLLALLPIDEWLLQPLDTRFAAKARLPARVDGIIVLGGAENARRSQKWGQPEFDNAAERDLAFIRLAAQYPKAKLVFTGGSGSMLAQDFKEADVAREFFKEQGLDPARVLFERESRNTFENARFSKPLANPQPADNWVLITSSWHMPRAVGIFCQAGWRVIPYPVDHRSLPGDGFRIDLDLAGHLEGLVTAEREWLGLLAYYVTGKTHSLLPGDCRI